MTQPEAAPSVKATAALQRLRRSMQLMIYLGGFALLMMAFVLAAVQGVIRGVLAGVLAAVGLLNIGVGLHMRRRINVMLEHRLRAD
ncbi:MAG TPA: hypothetical protein VFH54_14935 [Mycobacteriales bacterium]|nr:hypothetical protein [Mycobacteriales bacterium]